MFHREFAGILFHSPASPTINYPLLDSFGFSPWPHPSTTLSGDLNLPTNSTSFDADAHRHLSLADERRRRRMISNRESARRSRIRKKRHLDQLRQQVAALRAAGRQLLEELNQMMRKQEDVLRENAGLREEEEELRARLEELKEADNGRCNDVALMRKEAVLMSSSCMASPPVFPCVLSPLFICPFG
ncbi:Light-inducible protein CPRF2 [Platanthera zijinensis]|uniref:Light-inducible protein CPRF2 n=1 Tax=Platanthera zijinensis TaxID=2320716 RepID=A0AAP0B2V3_9ASPA